MSLQDDVRRALAFGRTDDNGQRVNVKLTCNEISEIVDTLEGLWSPSDRYQQRLLWRLRGARSAAKLIADLRAGDDRGGQHKAPGVPHETCGRSDCEVCLRRERRYDDDR